MSVRINRDNLTDDQKSAIRKFLCIQPKQVGFFKKKRFATAKDPITMWYLDKPKNEIVLPYVFGNAMTKTHINSQRCYPPGKFNFHGNLRDYQVPIIQTATNHLNTHGTTTLGLYPGAGKTMLSACLASGLCGLTLVVYPIKMVEQGWLNTFKQFTDASVWLNDGHNELPSSCNVILTMDTQFHKIPQQVLDMVRVLIIDEAHMFCVTSRIHCLLGVQPQYIIACTATLNRRDGMEKIIHSVCGTHGIFIKSPKHFKVYRFLTNIQTEIGQTKNGDGDWSQLVKDLSDDPLRNAYIVDLVERNPNHKIMILTWNKSHVYLLYDIFKRRKISVDILVGNKSTYNDSRVLIGTIGKIGTGFDEEMVCPDWGGERSNMMILTGSTKSLQGLEQFTGRVFRSEFPIIIDFVDNNRICKSHWNDRRKWYEDPERNGEIIYCDPPKSNNNQEVNNQVTNSDNDSNNNNNIVVNKYTQARLKLKLIT